MKELFEKFLTAEYCIYPLFLLCMIAEEISAACGNSFVCVFICLIVLMSLIASAYFKYKESAFSLYSVLTLFPLIRIISVAIPMEGIPETFRFAAVGIPLFLTGFIVAKMTGLTPKEMGFCLDKPYRQLLIVLLGLPLGFIEFFIDRPAAPYAAGTPGELILRIIILIVCTGLLEECLFRGILFNTVLKLHGEKIALYFTCFLYTALLISGKSLWNAVFAFFVSLLFCRIFGRLKSLWGLSFAHGLINITFYIICPHIFS